MKKKSIISLISICLLCAGLLCACGQKDETKSTNTQNEQTATTTQTQGTALYGKVTAIDGSSITLAIGEMPEPQGASIDGQATTGDQKTPPANQEQNSAATDSDKSRPTSQAPQGTPDANTQGNRELLTLTGETKEISVTDESIITNGKLADITVDTVLKLTYNGDTLTSVELVTPMAGPNGNSDGAPPSGTNGQNAPTNNSTANNSTANNGKTTDTQTTK